MDKAGRDWERYGKQDPYYGVLSAERFRGRLDAAHRAEFFRSGEEHIGRVLDAFRKDFSGLTAADFGCGVGRLLIPLAARFKKVVGIDVSPSMLAEARRNCDARNLTGVELSHKIDGAYDFIHSFIVFQHIPERRGLTLLQNLVTHLNPSGFGVLHFIYASRRPWWRDLLRWTRQCVPLAHETVNLLTGSKGPLMQMNSYSLNKIARLLHDADCQIKRLDLVDHQGWSGAIIYFERSA